MSSVRITAGSLRGRRIQVPRDDVRPTSERARQAFFNIVSDRIDGARFLDLFAGSGIFSFEAVSRGAREAVAVDSSRAHAAAIEKSAKELNVPIRVVNADALAGIKRLEGEVFDVLYADPPYAYERYDDLLTTIDNDLGLAAGALVAIEHRRVRGAAGSQPADALRRAESAPLHRLPFERRAEYGEVWISFFMT